MVRNVKIISVFLAVVLIFSFPLSCFAAEDLSPGESLMWDNFFNTLGEINKVAITCPKCGAGIRKKDGGTCPSCGFNASIDDGTVNNYRPGFESGGGSASPGGVGRNPAGYVSEGTSNIGQSGKLRFVMEHYYIASIGYGATNSYWCPHMSDENPKDGVAEFSCSDSYMTMEVSSPDKKFCPDLRVGYKFVTPVAGNYSVISSPQYDTVCNGRGDFKCSGKIDFDYSNVFCAKGQTIKVRKELSTHGSGYGEYWSSTFFHAVVSGPVVLEVEPTTVTINKQTNITINNNTWNGNIYVDNSTNLTYIYPQYTTINENNETVTNISNNPIIYNQETKQYYTYDQTTNNYYYITYGDPAPTPTPTPSPDPGGSTPDPGKPTPTPTPGGSGGSGGGSGDTPSGGGSNWWDKLLDDILSGLLEGVKGILKLLFDLISSILGWIIWLCSKVFDLFPFLPPRVGALLVGGVVICFILAFIKFIRG